MAQCLLVDVEDVTLIYKTAVDTDPEDVQDVNYLLGVIEGVLGKHFEKKVIKKDNDESNDGS